MIPVIDPGACEVITLTERVHHDGIHWRDKVRVEIHGARGCDQVAIGLPAGATLRNLRGRIDRYRMPDSAITDTQVHAESSPLGGVRVIVELNTRHPGDIITLSFERYMGLPAPFYWEPGLTGAREATLHMPLFPFTTANGIEVRGRTAYAANPSNEAWLRLRHPWGEDAPPDVPVPVDQNDLAPEAALARLAPITAIDRAVVGDSVIAGRDVFTYQIADDRGFARTLVALTEHGPQPAQIARLIPANERGARATYLEVAVIVGADGVLDPLVPPSLSLPAGILVLGDRSQEFPAHDGIPRDPISPVVTTDIALETSGRDLLGSLRSMTGTWTERATLHWEPGVASAKIASITLSPDLVDVRADCDRVHITPTTAWLVAGQEQASCTLTLVHRLSAPWAARTPELATTPLSSLTATWHHPDGTDVNGIVVEDGAGWRLVAIGETPFLDGPDALARRLDERWRLASIPEPGHPLRALGRQLTWNDIPDLLRLAQAEVIVSDALNVPPDVPRPLLKARKSGIVTRPELAMLLTLYLRQHKLDADWFLVAPGEREHANTGSPLAYTDAVVRVVIDGAVGWIAPACRACLPFELPPELAGSAAIGPSGAVTLPGADPGPNPHIGDDGRVYREDNSLAQGATAVRVHVASDGVILTLGGLPAFKARAGAMPWPEGSIVTGLSDPSQAVKVALPAATPLRSALPAIAQPGVYERISDSRVRASSGSDVCASKAERWQVTRLERDGVQTLRLVVRVRDLTSSDFDAIEACFLPVKVDREPNKLDSDPEQHADQ